jgi:hypothetical protein
VARTDVASFLHGKTEFMDSDETASQEKATDFSS